MLWAGRWRAVDAAGDQLRDIENLIGSAHADILVGDGGDNVLEGGDGADKLDGGTGRDTASYKGSSAAVNVTLATGGTVDGGDATGDSLAGIENLIGSAQGDTLVGDDGANVLDRRRWR